MGILKHILTPNYNDMLTALKLMAQHKRKKRHKNKSRHKQIAKRRQQKQSRKINRRVKQWH